MIRLTAQDVCALHETMADFSGGGRGLRDEGLLQSAVHSAYADYFGTPLYPTPIQKAARLAFALTSNHPFLDGNKRIGVLSMLTLLRLEGTDLTYTQEELIDLSLSIAKSEADYEAILAWLRAHTA